MSKPKAIMMGTPEMESPFYTMFQNTTNNINKKLDKLLKLFEDRVMYKTIDYAKVKEIEMRYTTTRKISKEDMIFCNEMWKKYNK